MCLNKQLKPIYEKYNFSFCHKILNVTPQILETIKSDTDDASSSIPNEINNVENLIGDYAGDSLIHPDWVIFFVPN